MDYFIEQLRIVLPVLGVDLFRGRVKQPAAAGHTSVELQGSSATATSPRPVEPNGDHDPEASPIFRLERPKVGIDARAQVIGGKFTILAGSLIVPAMRPTRRGHNSSTERAYEMRQATLQGLIDEGSLAIENQQGRLTRDVVFSSASAAGAVALGQASLNGRIAWLTSDGKTFAEWETGSLLAEP